MEEQKTKVNSCENISKEFLKGKVFTQKVMKPSH